MANFTPGPWHADTGTIRDSNGNALGSYPWGIGDYEDHSNGELMAAAPELLEACIFALKELENITTADFQHGGDIRIRETLERAIMPFIDHGAE